MKHQQKTQFTLKDLIKGLDVTINGDPSCKVNGVSTIQQAQPGHITFLVNPVYKKYLPETKASAVILAAGDLDECPTNAIVARDPYFAYAKIAVLFHTRPHQEAGIHPSAVIGPDCKLDASVSIGPNAVLGRGVILDKNVTIGPGCCIGDDVEIGEGSKLDANVTLYYQVKIGKHVIISSGTVVGSDGFGIAKYQGVWHKVPQLGRVIIEDDVEIGANCAIDRGAIEDTVIEKGVKLDNLIQIGHNVRVGEGTAIAGCAAIAGSATVGKNCLIGGKAGVAGHITIADNVAITGASAITKTIREPGIYSSGVGGVVTNAEWRKNSARLHRLDTLMQRVKALEAILEEKER